MDHQRDPSADSFPHGAAGGTPAPAAPGVSKPRAGTSELREDDAAIMLAAHAAESSALVTSMLRTGALAVLIFQVAYTPLDRIEYPLKFAQTRPLHITGMIVGLLALLVTVSPLRKRNWRGLTLAIYAIVTVCTAWIAVIESDSDVLVGSILMSSFAAGALVPWSPRWQAALLACGPTALLGYWMCTTDPMSSLGIAWMMVLSTVVLSQVSSVQGTRYRRKLAEQLAALAENGRLLRREMDLRAEIAKALQLDHAKLQASETMLRRMFEASPDNIAINSLLDGRFIAVNDSYQVAGYKRADVIASDVIKLGMWPKLGELERFVRCVRETGGVKNMEITQRRKNGALETNLISASFVEVDGEDCVLSMTRDISEIKRVETRLRASYAAMRKIFDATLDVIIVTRVSDGSHIDFNQQLAQLGYGRKDLDEANAGTRQLWASKTQRREFQARVMTDGVVRNMEADFVLPNGSVIPAAVAAVRVELEGEDCVVTMVRDLTATREASRRLEESVKALSDSEQTFRRLFDANLDGMTLNGGDGIYIDVNREFSRTTGFSREEAVGHHFTELNLWIHPDEMIAFSDQLLTTDEVRNLEVTFRHKDGSEHPVLISAVNLELYGQTCCLTIAREITDVKMTQRELVAAREEALASSQAKSEFLSSMSHEIRTPMNAILGMADLLMETELDLEQRRYLSTVISNSHALLALINGILDLARVESGRLSLEAVEFDPRDVTEKALETLAIRAHEKGLELMVRFAPEVPEFALGDSFRLGQILINLIGNAIKFTQKGQVLVAVEPDANSAAAGGLKFTVTDTGVGIPADKLHLLFNAFTQADSSTSRRFGGSGLGLAIVSRLVALMHGKVAVASEPGTGSQFSFTAQFGMPDSQPAQLDSPDRALREARIILVDDNSDCRSILADLLRAQGAQVTEADSTAKALDEINRDVSSSQRSRIVLLDGRMPAPGGFELASRLANGPSGRPPIVMMLGTNDLSNEVAHLRAIGVNSYVVKPVRRAELFAAIARACEGVRNEPRGEKPRLPVVAPAPSSPAPLDRRLKILMADDSPDNRALIRAYLKKTPYSVEEAENGQQAIDKFIAGKFDLVLMDIQMPIVDGYEATSTIRGWERANDRHRTPIVALTASALEDAAQRSRAAGCDAHVTKPIKKSTLFGAIRDAMEGQPFKDAEERAEVIAPREETCRTG